MDYVLKDRDSPMPRPRPYRLPRVMEGYAVEPGRTASRFVYALVDDLHLDPGPDGEPLCPR